MKWLAGGLTFVNATTISALLLGTFSRGLSRPVAALSVVLGVTAAVFAFFVTKDVAPGTLPGARKGGRYSFSCISFWLLAAIFAFFAFRSFAWLLFADGGQLKVQSPNNLGDLALHVAYIQNFASGVPLWPENPIYVFSNLRYPAGTDLFNSLGVLLGCDLTRSLIWAGLIGSLAGFYALYRWGGIFGLAGFLFNGGLAGFQVLQTWKLLDYQGGKAIAWKSLALSMFVTQRGLLYALPAGLLLLCQWRTKYRAPPDEGTSTPRASLPFWLELTLYASMPLFHVHTFMALSIVAAFLFVIGNTAARKQLALLAGIAFLPATFFVWTITDHFRARSLLAWKPGWVQNSGDFAAPFVPFWFLNFGVLLPLVLLLVGMCIWRIWQVKRPFRFGDHSALAFLIPAGSIFLFACLVKTAPWEWDNIKLIFWAYLIMLPFLWSELIARWPVPVRVGVCIALFASGSISLFGGLLQKENGYSLVERAELDGVGAAVRRLPVTARYAAFPTYNHPLLLQGRKVVLGYPGHLWTQGFDYSAVENKLSRLMKGEPGWREEARELQVRYLFWGREEKLNYTASTRPWESELRPIASGNWGAIYDLESVAEIPKLGR